VENVGEPCAEEPHARFDGGREETSTSRDSRAEPGASRLPDQPPSASRQGETFRWMMIAMVTEESGYTAAAELKNTIRGINQEHRS
jgi:hypothetical protein